MNKKGFTLVELLAVIVIMAVVVLIAIPNVMNSLNQAKKDNFGNEVNNLYSTAKTQFNLDKGRGKIRYKTVEDRRYGVYCNGITAEEHAGCENTSPLASNNADGVKYKIMVDIDGRVAYMYITDGRFYYMCDGDECASFDENRIIDRADAGSVDEYVIQDGPTIHYYK